MGERSGTIDRAMDASRLAVVDRCARRGGAGRGERRGAREALPGRARGRRRRRLARRHGGRRGARRGRGRAAAAADREGRRGDAGGGGRARRGPPSWCCSATPTSARSAARLRPLLEAVERGEATSRSRSSRARSAAASGSPSASRTGRSSNLTGLDLRAPISGQRALRREVLDTVTPFAPRFGMEIGMTVDAARAGYRLARSRSTSSTARPGARWRLRPPLPPAARLHARVRVAAAVARALKPPRRCRRSPTPGWRSLRTTRACRFACPVTCHAPAWRVGQPVAPPATLLTAARRRRRRAGRRSVRCRRSAQSSYGCDVARPTARRSQPSRRRFARRSSRHRLRPVILAIDQGTTGTTCLVFDAEARARRPRLSRVRPALPAARLGRARRRRDLGRHARGRARGAGGRRRRARRAVGVGITNQRETVCVWDPRPASRCTARSSGRTAAPPRAATSCASAGYEPLVRDRTGLVLDPYFSGDQDRLAARARRRPRRARRATGARSSGRSTPGWPSSSPAST